MPINVVLEEQARLELLEAWHWYESKETGLGLELEYAFDEALAAVLDDPLRWRKIFGEVRKYNLDRFPYAIVYTFKNNTLNVYAVVHLNRKPYYWTDRL